MRLLASTDFALRVLMRLAATPGDLLTVEQLAHAVGGLSRNHLHKIVQDLAAQGLVRTSRGPRGGVALAVPPGAVRMGTLVRTLEAKQPLVECFRTDGGNCPLGPVCPLHGMLWNARESFLATLDRHTLADCLSAGAFAGPPALESA